jgi:hypothetical protein
LCELLLESHHQVEHLCLYGDVERRDRLVRDDELRLDRERAGDADPLPLTAAELVGPPAGELGREPDALEQVGDARRARLLRHDRVHVEHLLEHLAYRHRRVQRRIRILEDHLDPLSELARRPLALPEHAPAFEEDVAGRRLLELEQQAAEGALTGAALADEAESLAALDRERDVLDRDERLLLAAQAPQYAALLREVLREAHGFEERSLE